VLRILFTTYSLATDIERIFSTYNLMQSKFRNVLRNEKTKLVFILMYAFFVKKKNCIIYVNY